MYSVHTQRWLMTITWAKTTQIKTFIKKLSIMVRSDVRIIFQSSLMYTHTRHTLWCIFCYCTMYIPTCVWASIHNILYSIFYILYWYSISARVQIAWACHKDIGGANLYYLLSKFAHWNLHNLYYRIAYPKYSSPLYCFYC